MATYTLSSTLVNDPSYAQIGSFSLAPGDTIVNRINYTSGTGVSIVSETGGSPALGVNQATNASGYATFSYTTTTADASSSLYFYFWGADGNPYWNNITNFRGKVLITVSAAAACNAAAQGSITGISVASTESPTPACTVQGPTAAANCTLFSRARTLAQVAAGTDTFYYSGLTPGTSTTVRGETYQFEVVTGGFVSSPVTFQFTVPYLSTDLTVGVGTAEVVADNDGNWTQTVTGHDNETSHNNYRVYSGTTPLMRAPPLSHQFLNTGVGGSTISNTWTGNAPAVNETITYNLYGGRTASSGGSGIPGFAPTGTTFTVTRAAATHNESATNGTYFDNDLSTGAIHAATLSNLSNGFYYNINKDSNTSGSYLSTWTDDAATTKTVTDTSASVPSGTGTTSTTYYLWRSAASNGGSPTYTGVSYTRSLANYDRFSFQLDEVPLSGTDTEFTQTIGNTIVGHTYYIYSGSSILKQVTATGTTLTITVNESSLPNTGDTATHTLKTRSLFNSEPASAYNTGDTYTVIRTGSGETEEGADSSAYGLEVFNSDESAKLYDTTSRVGRIMKSGRIPSGSGAVAVGGNSGPISVPGLENTTDYQVIYLPEDGGVANTGSGYRATVAKSTNSFTITNFGTVATAWKYYVIKSGG